MNTYSIVSLRFLIFCRHLSIYVSCCLSRLMLKVKYLASMDRKFRALYFHDLFKISDAVVHHKNALGHYQRYFETHFGKLCFPKRELVYNKFIFMPSHVEFTSEQNGMIFNLMSKNIRLLSDEKKNNNLILLEKDFPIFHIFYFKNFSGKCFF